MEIILVFDGVELELILNVLVLEGWVALEVVNELFKEVTRLGIVLFVIINLLVAVVLLKGSLIIKDLNVGLFIDLIAHVKLLALTFGFAELDYLLTRDDSTVFNHDLLLFFILFVFLIFLLLTVILVTIDDFTIIPSPFEPTFSPPVLSISLLIALIVFNLHIFLLVFLLLSMSYILYLLKRMTFLTLILPMILLPYVLCFFIRLLQQLLLYLFQVLLARSKSLNQ